MTAPDPIYVMLLDADGRDYYAHLTVKPVGKGFARLTFTAAAGAVEGLILCRADLDPESVGVLRAALEKING